MIYFLVKKINLKFAKCIDILQLNWLVSNLNLDMHFSFYCKLKQVLQFLSCNLLLFKIYGNV